MRDGHVIEILESGPFDSLSEAELSEVRAHVGACAGCRRAYDAARVSAVLLRERVAEPFEPPPFFQTRVLAALRERQAEQQVWALPRLWKAAGALFASMLATVATLGALTFLAPGASPSDAGDEAAVEESYSAEESFLAQGGGGEDEMTYDQVLSVVYEPDSDGGAR